MFNIVLLVLLSVLSAILYRLGGIGKPFNAKLRDIGVPFAAYLYLITIHHFTPLGFLMLFLSWGFSFASMTTYFSFVCKPDDDVCWQEWFITGLVYGLSCFLLVWAGLSIYAIIFRAVLLAILTALWSDFIDDVDWEEWGRGALFTLTIPLLLL